MFTEQIVSPDYILRNNDLIKHVVHRHEPPSAGEPVQIVYDGREEQAQADGSPSAHEIVAVCKPSSVPVHGCGVYWHNSALGILYQMGFHPLYRSLCLHLVLFSCEYEYLVFLPDSLLIICVNASCVI